MGFMGSIAVSEVESNAILLAASLCMSIDDCLALITHRRTMKEIADTTASREKIHTIAGCLVTIVSVLYSVC